ncbi:MAG: molecular chaperone DnaK [Chloroflexi bacterium]|nr:molecular chaperone DnaK [Chloroflexota bacterium]
MAKVVGIDLGTTNSVVAFMEAGQPTVITNVEGARTTPSVVAYSKNGERLVGQLARRQSVLNPANTIYSAKRFVGRRFDEVDSEREQVSFEIVDGKGNEARIRIPQLNSDVTPEEISAMVLQKLKADAEEYLGEEVKQAVITVPAYFNDSQRQATKNAGTIAGLDVLRIINEPTAASLAYGLEKKSAETILVWDLGGGTFDVSVLEVGDGVFEVKATNGDTHLGGDDYDQRIVAHLVDEFKRDQGIDLRSDPQALQRLVEAAEKAKIELSTTPQTEINLPFITADQTGPKHLAVTLRRSRFEELVGDLNRRMVDPFRKVLRDAGITPEQVDEIVMVGGSTRMPAVQDLVKELTGKEPNRSVNPDEVVAIGAAIQAGIITGDVRDVVLLDVTPLSLGLETLGSVKTTLIERNTTIPTSKSEIFSTAEDGQTAVDIHILQGERAMAADNMTLGRFRLEGIPPAPRGVPQIEVTFDIDVNGIVNVKAKDTGTGKEQKITITASTNLDKDQIDALVQDAERHASEDRDRRELADLRNQADAAAYQVERLVNEHSDQLSDEEKSEIESQIAELRGLLDQDAPDLAELRRRTEELSQRQLEIGQRVYQTGANGQAGPDGADDATADADDVVDAEFSAADDEGK